MDENNKKAEWMGLFPKNFSFISILLSYFYHTSAKIIIFIAWLSVFSIYI